MKKLLILAILATFTLNNAQNCIKQIVCEDKVVTDQKIIDELYNISDFMKTYCSTAIGSSGLNKGALDLKEELNIHSSILTDILDINNKKIDVRIIDKEALEEIFLVADYLLIDLIKLLENNISSLKTALIPGNYSEFQISSE